MVPLRVWWYEWGQICCLCMVFIIVKQRLFLEIWRLSWVFFIGFFCVLFGKKLHKHILNCLSKYLLAFLALIEWVSQNLAGILKRKCLHEFYHSLIIVLFFIIDKTKLLALIKLNLIKCQYKLNKTFQFTFFSEGMLVPFLQSDYWLKKNFTREVNFWSSEFPYN